MTRRMKVIVLTAALALSSHGVMAQETEVDALTGATRQVTKTEEETNASSRLHIGGYGEAVYSHHFYSNNVFRYSHADRYKDAPGYGRVDLPHAVVMLGYDFGRRP